MTLLQITLLSNAVFSALTGVTLLLFFKKTTHWFGREKNTPFLILGLGLLIFAYTVYMEVEKPDETMVFSIIIQDLLWVGTSIFILIKKPFKLSELAYKVIAAVAIVVLIFAMGQFIGVYY